MKLFTLTALVSYATVAGGAMVLEPSNYCSYLLVALAIFVFLPLVMATSMFVVSLPLIAFVASCGTLQRNSGAGELIRDITVLSMQIVPGYIRALRGVRSPIVWGLATGTALATLTLTAWLIANPPGASLPL